MDAFPRFDLGGRTALVTGASRGLGEAISVALAAVADVALGVHDATAGQSIAAPWPAGSLVTGHTLVVDGGWTAR